MAAVKVAGFDGVEASLDDLGTSVTEQQRCFAAAQAEDVSLIMSAYSSWPNYEGGHADALSPVPRHVEALVSELRQIAHLSASVAGPSPLWRVNAHSGSDAWTEAEGREFFEAVTMHCAGFSGSIPDISHETHRGRYLCCPFATARMLQQVPSLRLTSDFSHWVIKCERLLDSPEERQLLDDIIAPAVDHIHARIGTPQAPQVADVEHPSAELAAERHYEWWEAIWTAREARSLSGRDSLVTATVEYGPAESGYTPLDSMHQPVAGHHLDETLRRASGALGRRFERWHSDGALRLCPS